MNIINGLDKKISTAHLKLLDNSKQSLISKSVKPEHKEVSLFYQRKHSSSNISFKYSHLRPSSMKPTSLKQERPQSSSNVFIDSHRGESNSKHVTINNYSLLLLSNSNNNIQ